MPPAFVSQEVADWEKVADAETKRQEARTSDTVERRRLSDEWRAAHPRPQATLAQVANHIDHVRKLAAADHVAIGSDFDGIEHTPVAAVARARADERETEPLSLGDNGSSVRFAAGPHEIVTLLLTPA